MKHLGKIILHVLNNTDNFETSKIMKNYIILICCALILYAIFSKIIDLINAVRIKKGLPNKIKISIQDDKTLLFNNFERELFNEPNDFIYLGNNGKMKKVLLIGDVDNENKINKKFNKLKICKKNFIKDFDEVIKEVDDFWYQYITYYVLKSKRKLGMSAFKIASVSICVDVTSNILKDKIKSELRKTIQTKKPKLFNILDIT